MEENKETKKKCTCELEPAGQLVEIPVTGWIDADGKVHFYDEAKDTVFIPASEIKELN